MRTIFYFYCILICYSVSEIWFDLCYINYVVSLGPWKVINFRVCVNVRCMFKEDFSYMTLFYDRTSVTSVKFFDLCSITGSFSSSIGSTFGSSLKWTAMSWSGQSAQCDQTGRSIFRPFWSLRYPWTIQILDPWK